MTLSSWLAPRRLVCGPGLGATPLAQILGFLAVATATVNVVGGFLVTDRMLEMFKSKKERKKTSSG